MASNRTAIATTVYSLLRVFSRTPVLIIQAKFLRFGTYPLSNQLGNATQQQVELSTFMQRTWSNFAKDPSAGVGWPSIGSVRGGELGILGANGFSGVIVRRTIEADYPCALYFTGEDALGLSH